MYQSDPKYCGGKSETVECTAIIETKNKQYDRYKGGKHQSTMHMCQCLIWSTPRTEEPHRWWYVIWLRTCTLQSQQKKNE